MVLDVNCENKNHLRVFRKKDAQFTLEQNPGEEQPLFLVCFLEDGEWDVNYDHNDWECNWPGYVGFVTCARNTSNYSGDMVKEGWTFKDFYAEEEDNTLIERPLDILPEYAVASLDLYRHSGDAWSYAGCGMQCRFDTSRGVGILYFDPTGLKELSKYNTEEQLKELVKDDFDLALHLLSEDIPDVYVELLYDTMGNLMHDGDPEYREYIYYDSFTERNKKFSDLIYSDHDPYEQVDFTILDDED